MEKQTPTDFQEDVAALADAEQQEALQMVASQNMTELIKAAAAADEQYQLLRCQTAIGWPLSEADLPTALNEYDVRRCAS